MGILCDSQIRELIGKTENFDLLQGHIEVDEMFFGSKYAAKGKGRGANQDYKEVVMGLKERHTGRMIARARTRS